MKREKILSLIYDEDGVQILYEESYDYIEIYGLTDEEFDLLVQESEGFFWEYN